METSVKYQVCSACKKQLLVSEYYFNRARGRTCYECKKCMNKKSNIWRLENKEKSAESLKKWISENKERHLAAHRIRCKRWHKKNPGQMKRWRINNPDKHKTKSVYDIAMRKASILKSTPTWANKFFIKEIYDLSRLRTKHLGIKHHVDHMVPLQHELVCGLHNEFNLAVIPAKANWSKNNRFWTDMP